MLKSIIYLAFLYMISEVILTLGKRSDKNSSGKKRDRGSMPLIWLVISICLTAGFYLGNHDTWTIRNYIISSAGIIIYLTGFIIRWVAIIQLKGAFTVDVAVSEGQELKTNGLYKRIRHPSYLGILLIIAGLGIAMNSILSFFVVFVPVFLAINYRIIVEEKLLLEFFGERYREYSDRTNKLIPYIF